jgi:hypothetical protein
VTEWTSGELAFRFMALAYGVVPYSALPENVVRAYTPASGGSLSFVANGTAGVAPQPGDVISFDSATTTGHVAIVVGSSVDPSTGSGSVTLMSQNDTTTGWRTVPVIGWTVRGFGVNQTTDGWLHAPGGVNTGHPGTGRVTIEAPTDSGPRPEPTPEPPATTGPRLPPPHHG